MKFLWNTGLAIVWIAALLALGAHPRAKAEMPIEWLARLSIYKGDASCAYGQADCNRCVYNVEQQFRAMTSSGKYRTVAWDIGGRNDNRAPSFRQPENILTGQPGGSAHFQGFIRVALNQSSAGNALFASYGGASGGIFGASAVTQPDGRIGRGSLQSIYTSVSNHAGGMQAVGHKVLIAHYDGKASFPMTEKGERTGIQVLDVTQAVDPTGQLVAVNGLVAEGKPSSQAANVAAAKLAGGGFLLLFAPTSGAHKYAMYYSPSLEPFTPERVWDPDVGVTAGLDVNGYENLSMVTECGTGDLYVVGTNAAGAYVGSEPSTWGLYRIDPGPQLTFVARNSDKMYGQTCDPRAASSVFATVDGRLAGYCHQKLGDPDQRENLVRCAVGVFLFVGLDECLDAAIPDSRIMFREYLSGIATPETPVTPVTMRRVEITVNQRPNTNVHSRLGVILSTGDACEIAPPVQSRTCSVEVEVGSQLHMMPFYGQDIVHPRVDWDDGRCPVGSDGLAGLCTVTVTENAQYSLSGGTVVLF